MLAPVNVLFSEKTYLSMKKYLLLASLLFISYFAFSQHEADKWYFGIYDGLDFISGSPVFIPDGALATTEGSASMSDGSGNLLFYTDGVTVWNKNNQVMPNGTGLYGNVSSTQSALIVPLPGSSSQYYYIFTVDADGGPLGFRYSIVDMLLDGGLGDVSTKNELIHGHVTEKIAAEIQSNGFDYWIMAHEFGTNSFLAYSLTTGGLDLNPIVSSIGMVHSDSIIQNSYGQMKFSTCDDRLVVATGYLDTVQVFRFDPATGEVFSAITLPIGYHTYGVEFSPNGHILYVSNYDPYHTLLQFDISSGIADTILATKLAISNAPDIYALQLGPDEKIYACRSFNAWLGVVNDPDVPGANCNYTDNGFNLDPNYLGITSGLGLPSFMQTFFRGKNNCIPTSVGETALDEQVVYPNPSAGPITISLTSFVHPAEITVCNLEGKIMERITTLPGNKKVSFGENLSPGIYAVLVRSDDGVKMLKVVKISD